MKKNSMKGKVIRIAVIAAVIIIPLLYSYLYLGAFWDPYSRLESLPVAVVNNDKGALINDEQRNVGQEMCDKLSEEAVLKFVFTDETDAKAGTEDSDYYAMIVIPEDFSSDIASASTKEKHTASISYSANEKRNYLASQILSRAVLEIEETMRDSVNKEIVQHLADTINEVPDQLTELQDGLNQLNDGSKELMTGTDALADATNTLANGTKTLEEGTDTFRQKLTQYQKGVDKLQDGSVSIVSGTSDLDGGIDALLKGANQLTASTANLDQLTGGAKTLAAGAQSLNAGLVQYTDGVDALITSVNSTTAFLKQYVTVVNPAIMKDPVFAGFISKLSASSNAGSIEALQAASSTLREASKQIAEGADALSAGSKNLPQLKTALNTLAVGLEKAKTGSAALSEGAKTLSAGMTTAKDATAQLSGAAADIAAGAAKLNNGAAKLNDGAAELKSGAAELSDGIATAKSGVDTAISHTNGRLDALDGLAAYAEAPVTVEQNNVTSVPNYGTAFAPYFLSLSLWVGALIMFVGIYLDQEGKFRILTCNSEHRVARSFLYLLIGFAQAIVLALALQYGLGLKVDNKLLYYASCCLVSMVFISIVQFLMVHLKDLGKFLSIVMLILQLTSCGGTFPMETIPKFFSKLYPYMPMTYSVGLFKQSISGVVSKDAIYNAVILLVILAVFMTATILLSAMKAKRAAKVKLKEDEIALQA